MADTFILCDQANRDKNPKSDLKDLKNVTISHGFVYGCEFSARVEVGFNACGQKVYVDSRNCFKDFIPSECVGYRYGYYYRIGDILTEKMIKEEIDLARSLGRIDHLPAFLLIQFCTEGKSIEIDQERDLAERIKMEVEQNEDFVLALDKANTDILDLFRVFLVHLIQLPAKELNRVGWVLWNVHNTKFEELFDDESQAICETTRQQCIDTDLMNRFNHQCFAIMKHTQGIKDGDMLELMCRLDTNLPDNKIHLRLLEQ